MLNLDLSFGTQKLRKRELKFGADISREVSKQSRSCIFILTGC